MEERMKVGQIVWVKLRGFPWWPGVKSQGIEPHALIKFIGDMTHTTIALGKLCHFEENYNEYSKTKKKNLLSAIEIAKKINQGEMTLSQHFKTFKNGTKTTNIQSTPISPLGMKRARNEPKISCHLQGLNTIIEDFIYTKKNIQSEEEFEATFAKLRKNINMSKINSNSLHALNKCFRFLSCSRNFSHEITKKNIFIQLKEDLKEKIIELLFDDNAIDFNLLEEKEGQYDKNSFNLNDMIDTMNCIEQSSSLSLISPNIDNESSINLSSESKTDYEDLKTKITIMPLEDTELIDILSQYSQGHGENNRNVSIGDHIKTVIKSQQVSICNKVACPYLRKRVCQKLFFVFQILFKNTMINDEIIKAVCVALENKARLKDQNMSKEYRDNILQIFKKIKEQLCLRQENMV